MTKLEMIKFTKKEELVKCLKAFLNGESYNEEYTHNGIKKIRSITKNKKLFFGKHSLTISEANNGECYLNLEYFGVTDRINLAKHKKVSAIDL